MSAVLRPVDQPMTPVAPEAKRKGGQSDDGSSSALAPRQAGLVLRILSGAHLGAEVPVTAERVLIGNLEHECDVVLDVGRTERHACLLRVSADGWTVLAIAGDAWVDSDYLSAQETRTFQHGQCVTLGRIAFAVGSSNAARWNEIRPPLNLVKPGSNGAEHVAAALPTPPTLLNGWRSIRLGAGVGIGALVLAAGIAYLGHVMTSGAPAEDEAARRLKLAQSELAATSIGTELRVEADPEDRGKVLLTGYVAEAAHVASAEQVLRGAGLRFDTRVIAADVVAIEIARRVKSVERRAIAYVGAGTFSIDADAVRLPGVDNFIRIALQELPGIGGIRVRVLDINEPDGSPALVVYRRSHEGQGSVAIDGGDLVQRTRVRYQIREIRLGALPSVLFTDGKTHFVGARLPEGWTVEAINGAGVTLRYADKSRVIAVNPA